MIGITYNIVLNTMISLIIIGIRCSNDNNRKTYIIKIPLSGISWLHNIGRYLRQIMIFQ